MQTDNDPDKTREKRPDNRSTWLAVLITIGVASIAIRLLMRYDFDESALLYVGIPFLISLAITAFRPPRSREQWWHAYRDHTYTALIVFLGSSILLFEGFVCVLMFMPIYLLAISVGFVIGWIQHVREKQRGVTFASILPLAVLATSFEGVSDSLSFDRESRVSVSKIADATPAEIMENIAQPFDLQKDRGWLISIFPMPYRIEAGSLNPGDVHRVYTRYHRWFATNTHEGEMHLQIASVEPRRVRTRFIHDSTYFASYLTVHGTEIELRELSPGRTEVTLHIDFTRELDPAWYFQPLQRYGVSQMAAFLIDEVMIRE